MSKVQLPVWRCVSLSHVPGRTHRVMVHDVRSRQVTSVSHVRSNEVTLGHVRSHGCHLPEIGHGIWAALYLCAYILGRGYGYQRSNSCMCAVHVDFLARIKNVCSICTPCMLLFTLISNTDGFLFRWVRMRVAKYNISPWGRALTLTHTQLLLTACISFGRMKKSVSIAVAVCYVVEGRPVRH